MDKIVIPDRDINDPEETREVSPVELELSQPTPSPAPFVSGIASAAKVAGETLRQDDAKREARVIIEQGRQDTAAKLAELGLALSGGGNLRAYRAKPRAAYRVWERAVELLAQNPDMLALGVGELAQWLDAREPNFTINRDMMYDHLNPTARIACETLLSRLGKPLRLKAPVSIASVRKQLIALRDADRHPEVEQLTLRVSIRGNTATVNGKDYQIQRGASGKARVKRKGVWLYLDTLREFCSG